MFLTDGAFREHYRTPGPVLVWINLDIKEPVNELSDLDGNLFRIFYDFSTPEREGILNRWLEYFKLWLT